MFRKRGENGKKRRANETKVAGAVGSSSSGGMGSKGVKCTGG